MSMWILPTASRSADYRHSDQMVIHNFRSRIAQRGHPGDDDCSFSTLGNSNPCLSNLDYFHSIFFFYPKCLWYSCLLQWISLCIFEIMILNSARIEVNTYLSSNPHWNFIKYVIFHQWGLFMINDTKYNSTIYWAKINCCWLKKWKA